METKKLFQKNAHVLASNAEEVGSLERVVVDPATNVLSHIVVSKGSFLNKEDKLVPIELVAETTPDQIVLSPEAGDPSDLPLFETRQLVDGPPKDQESSSSEDVPPVFLGYPVPGTSISPISYELLFTHIVQNIPEGMVAMKEGAKVITAEGEHVGNVERVLADAEIDQVTHLLISRGLITKVRKLIPIKWVTAIGEDKVHLRVEKNSVEKLAIAG